MDKQAGGILKNYNENTALTKHGKGSKLKGLGIKAKLLCFLLPVIVIVISGILLLIYFNTSNIVLQKSEELLQTSTESVVNDVKAWMNEAITALNSERDTLQYFPMDAQQELDYIKHTAKQYDAFPAGIYIATIQGKLVHASFVPSAEYNLFEQSWYKEGLRSEDFVFGSVYFDNDSKAYVVGASGMLKDNTGKVRGVAAADIYLNAISNIVKQVKLEQTGGIFLVDTNTNVVIGHADDSIVGKTLKEQTGGIYSFVEESLKNGKTGLQTFKEQNGSETYIDITQVPNSKWATVAYVPKGEIMAELNKLTSNIIFLAAAGILILFIMMIVLIRRIIDRPVREIDHVARKIADGALNESISYHSNDEFGALAVNFNKTVSKLRNYVEYIDEISAVLNEIAAGNLVFTLTHDYAGDFSKIKTSLNHISLSLNSTISQINQTSGQVTSGSEQVASSAQALSQGATEQAGAIEELAATIGDISNQIRKNAENAQDAKKEADAAGNKIVESNSKMQDMITAMEQISEKSDEIGKIIKTIEDIAFQTNILALNAAVEAARAGAAGKGFAVVADEVRNLAGKSSEAAKNTTKLISETISSVKNGTAIAGDTAKSMDIVVEKARQVISLVEKIALASNEQADSVAQVTVGIDQISSVVQTNSATAEESAAAGEELSSQAQILSNLVEQFRLRDDC